ncbi:MAG: CU044_2847 family protein [Streptosporangiaceae bacterium]
MSLEALAAQAGKTLVAAARFRKGADRMPYFLEVPLSGGEIVLAEITGQVDDVALFGRGKDVLGRLSGSLSEQLAHVRSLAGEVLGTWKDSHEPPDRVAVEFGLTFSAKAGLVVAEAAGEGHLTVTVEWSRSADPKQSRRAGSGREG